MVLCVQSVVLDLRKVEYGISTGRQLFIVASNPDSKHLYVWRTYGDSLGRNYRWLLKAKRDTEFWSNYLKKKE